ncbi:hypothetical protein [Pseudonocardia sp.]
MTSTEMWLSGRTWRQDTAPAASPCAAGEVVLSGLGPVGWCAGDAF